MKPRKNHRVIIEPSWKKKILFSLMACFFSLLMVELGFRIYLAFQVGPHILFYGLDSESSKQRKRTVLVQGNFLGNYYKYFPNQVKVDNDAANKSFKVTINSKGFRGKEFDDEKKTGVVRIVTLGASSTFGFKNRDNETYPYYLEQLLKSKDVCSNSYEVINLGIPLLKSDQILSLFLDEAIKLNPDIVTFYEGINDSSTREARKKSEVFSNLFRETFRQIRHTVLFINFIYKWQNHYYRKFTAQDIRNHIEGKAEHFLGNLSRIHQECKKRGIIFIVANQQAQSLLLARDNLKGITYKDEVAIVEKRLAEQGYLRLDQLHFLTHNTIMTALDKWVAANNVPFVNMIDALDQNRNELLSWVHLSPRGNRVLARAFAEKIEALLCPKNTGFPK